MSSKQTPSHFAMQPVMGKLPTGHSPVEVEYDASDSDKNFRFGLHLTHDPEWDDSISDVAVFNGYGWRLIRSFGDTIVFQGANDFRCSRPPAGWTQAAPIKETFDVISKHEHRQCPWEFTVTEPRGFWTILVDKMSCSVAHCSLNEVQLATITGTIVSKQWTSDPNQWLAITGQFVAN